MDPETRAYLEQALGGMRNDFAGLRGEFIGLRTDVADLRTEFADLRTDVADLRTEFADLRTDVVDLRTEFADLRTDVADLRTEVRATAVETRRHFDVTAEALRHDVQGIAEGLGLAMEQIAGLRTEMDERFRAQESVMRLAFQEVRRDIDELRARL